MEQLDPANLLRILLLRAGIESNPGPNTIYTCSVCSDRLNRNCTSVRCTQCQGWCHMRRCSGLSHTGQWSPSYIAPCCYLSRNQTTTHTPPQVYLYRDNNPLHRRLCNNQPPWHHRHHSRSCNLIATGYDANYQKSPISWNKTISVLQQYKKRNLAPEST